MSRPGTLALLASLLAAGSAWPQGTPLGPEFRVNTYTSYGQAGPHVASDAAGNFVVVWVSYNQDGSQDGVFGQRYSEIVPVDLMRFGVE